MINYILYYVPLEAFIRCSCCNSSSTELTIVLQSSAIQWLDHKQNISTFPVQHSVILPISSGWTLYSITMQGRYKSRNVSLSRESQNRHYAHSLFQRLRWYSLRIPFPSSTIRVLFVPVIMVTENDLITMSLRHLLL